MSEKNKTLIFKETMEEQPFDYSEVPRQFGLCAARDCPQSATCLRQISYNFAPASYPFLSTLNPRKIAEMTPGKCEYYCSNKKVRYAKGFLCTTESLPVRVSPIFRYRLIGSWGFRRYYQKRKGETLLSPAEQRQVIALAKELGLKQQEYFDAYKETYCWK